jgi:phosphoribosyl 1,2-cyclic phosphate phosphodiesterase
MPTMPTASMTCGRCAMAAAGRSRAMRRTKPCGGCASGFGYVFAGQHGYPTIVNLETSTGCGCARAFRGGSCQMPHGPGASTAYRFECDGKSIGYATDFSAITREMVELFAGVDVLVVDCLRREPHPTHAHLGMALELTEAAGRGKRC